MAMSRNLTSAQELFNLMNENDLIRILNHHYYEGEYAGSAKVQEELLAWINSNNIMLNGKKITLNNLEIHEGGNNFNIIIKADNIGLVLQFGLRPPAVDESIQFLTSTGERPKWLAHQYDQKSFAGTSQYIILNSPREKDKHPDNPFDTQNVGLLTVQEFCPNTLKNKVTELHKPQAKTDYAQVVKLTADVGKSMSELLSDISGNDVLWTDLKPGNILFHANGTLAIADTKAFMPIEKNAIPAN